MRVLHPDIVFASIASSAVTHATVSYWEYYDLIRNYTPTACRDAIESTVQTVDFLLDLSAFTRKWVKQLFGLAGLQDDADFGSVLSASIIFLVACARLTIGLSFFLDTFRFMAKHELGSCCQFNWLWQVL